MSGHLSRQSTRPLSSLSRTYCPTAADCSGLDGKEVDSGDPRLSALIVFCLCPDSRLSCVSGGLEEHEALKKRGSLYLLLERIRRFGLGKKLKSVLAVRDHTFCTMMASKLVQELTGCRSSVLCGVKASKTLFFNSLHCQTSCQRTRPKWQPVQKAKLENLERLGVS